MYIKACSLGPWNLEILGAADLVLNKRPEETEFSSYKYNAENNLTATKLGFPLKRKAELRVELYGPANPILYLNLFKKKSRFTHKPRLHILRDIEKYK